MSSQAWYAKPLPFAVSCLIVPPVGLVGLWWRPSRLWKKIGGTVLLLILTVAYLVALGLRVEMSGSGMSPIFSFRTKERKFAAVEVNRATQAKQDVPVTLSQAAAVPSVPAYWTDFRGPLRDGIYTQMKIIAPWPDKGLQQLWKQPIGGGYASFVFGDGRAYTIEQRRNNEVVAAYDFKTGRELWTHSYAALFEENMGGDGPRATPTFHAGLVYSLGATGHLKVLDATSGKVRWEKNILTEHHAENVQWGMCGAPLIFEDKVIVQPGGKGSSVVAYDKKTGKLIWKSQDDNAGYASPALAVLNGKQQLVTMTATRMISLDPSNGYLLWDYPWVTQFDVNSAQPIPIDATHVFVSSGYGHGAALVEIAASAAKTVWQNTRMKNRFNSSVLRDGYVYGLDENILACVRASDGNLMWKGGRYGYGQVLLAGEHLVVLTESGELVLVRAQPEKFTEVSKFQAIEGKTWNVPAIEDGVLLVRNGEQMAAFRIGK
ncbi:MAG: PQQ-like beta-propeller repeat protein [Candidatus Solibacter usitatus]|nr:PQQ-like beta-propeller repeat protein [Candidatus Solibacter usitatus]